MTNPTPSSTQNGNASGTITSTATFQQVFAANTKRKGCTIINYSSANNMYVTEGIATASATTTQAVMLPPENSAGVPQGYYYCQVFGVVLQGQINIDGTSGDAFYAAQY